MTVPEGPNEQPKSEVKTTWTERVETPIASALVRMLSVLLSYDRVAATRLVEFRTPCNRAVAESPDVVVRVVDERRDAFDVGLIGLLQAACATEKARIATVYDCESGMLTGFRINSLSESAAVFAPVIDKFRCEVLQDGKGEKYRSYDIEAPDSETAAVLAFARDGGYGPPDSDEIADMPIETLGGMSWKSAVALALSYTAVEKLPNADPASSPSGT